MNQSSSNLSLPGNHVIITTESITAALFTCILIILTLTANLFVCVATLRTNSARPLTNYFIINLCIADILIAIISMPVWVLFQIYGLALGRVLGLRFLEFWGSFDILCGTASILSLSCISVDRYMAITRPFTYVRCMTCRRAFLMTCVIWLYAGMVAFVRTPLKERGVYAWFVLFASFIIPFIVILAAYTKIFQK
ncbi:D(5)-like dopamine receptor [Nematostella vectensis]|uniref:D(5)-like dopamine receptor n=1 Tax=Nematostella vectensis TaxID=45351 RepID=UPI002076F3B2|nr:D(5)-like dopamine receptor [Nematostella vectensis]